MPRYQPPTQDAAFLLHEVFQVAGQDIPGYGDLEEEVTALLMEEAGKLAADFYAPCNADGDKIGCRLEEGRVITPPGFVKAHAAMRDGGWTGLDMPEEWGGQGLPLLLHVAVSDFLTGANVSLVVYQVLTHGAAQAILAHGTDEQKQTYLPRMISGEWSGSMNLTEPHSGTDLGLLRTRALPQADGAYHITGQKIFISGGDHDLAENVVHLVLARLPDAPAGVKGISLFIVPKFLPDRDGKSGTRNAVSVGALEKKMGLHGNATCVMNYDGATGFLLGKENKGLSAMFTMMNEARLSTSLQGVSIGEAAYQVARDYALNRRQGRAFGRAQNPDAPADPLIVHPDIRRNLLDQKGFVEGGRALVYWGAMLIDRAHRNGDKDADALISLLIPVMKGFLSDKGFDMAVQAQQVLGGHGYIEEHGMSQFVRDARIAQIYEGANGIHALDLVARKLAAGGGKAMRDFLEIVAGFIVRHQEHDTLGGAFMVPLARALSDLQIATEYLATNVRDNPEAALSGSYDFMHLFGHVCLGFMWARQAVAAQAALDAGRGDAGFLRAKLGTGRFYMARQLPLTAALKLRVESGGALVMDLPEEAF